MLKAIAKITIYLGTAAALLTGLFSIADRVFAHDAPEGWRYGYECCSSYDCRQVSASAIEERPDGYHVTLNGDVIPYGSRKIKRSRDEFFHLCTVAGADDGATICLYEPMRGF